MLLTDEQFSDLAQDTIAFLLLYVVFMLVGFTLIGCGWVFHKVIEMKGFKIVPVTHMKVEERGEEKKGCGCSHFPSMKVENPASIIRDHVYRDTPTLNL